MTIELSEFWGRLVQSGAANAEKCRRFAAGYAKASGGSPPSNAVDLAKFLARNKVLSPFQAKALLADEFKPIRFGNYLQTEHSAADPFSSWIPVSIIGENRKGILFQPNKQQIGGGRDQWVAAHAKVSHPSLQSIEPSSEKGERSVPSVIVFSDVGAGKLLLGSLKENARIATDLVCQIGSQLCEALSAMHSASLWHGAVRMDRIWIGKGMTARLLRDPSGPPLAPNASNPVAWIDTLDSSAAYCAPETASGHNAQTDLYSLGCLLYRLAVGNLPFKASDPEELQRLHASQMPEPIVDAMQQGESGDPLLRVLAYALAKNPSARFTSAEQFGKALGAVHSAQSSAIPETIPKTISETTRMETQEEKVTPPKSEAKTQVAPDSRTKSKASVPQVTQPQVAESRITEPQPPITNTTQPTVAEPTPNPQDEAESQGNAPTASSPRRRRRKKKKNILPFVIGGLGVPLILLFIAYLLRDPNASTAEKSRRPRPPIPDVIPSVTNRRPTNQSANRAAANNSSANSASSTRFGYQVVDDDRLLWLPPFATEKTAPLGMLPPGASSVLSMRLSSILNNAASKNALDAFSTEVSNLIEKVTQRTKIEKVNIDRIGVAMHPGKDGWPEVSLAVSLLRPQPLDELTKAWDVSAARTRDGKTIYAGEKPGSDAYFVRADDSKMVSSFAVGSVDRISEVAEIDGADASLPRSVSQLWKKTSDQSDFVIGFMPNFLFADGRNLLSQSAPKFVDPLKRLLFPNVNAVVATVHFDDERLFTELKMSPGGTTSEPALLNQVREAIDAMPHWADDFLIDSIPDTSWRLLANRLPGMLRFLSEQTRFDAGDQTIIVNAYLPTEAASQLTLASLLALNTTGSATPTASVPQTQKLTVAEMLDQKMSISFDQESLEFGINMIVEQFGDALPEGNESPEVRIVGGDLQKMGITQNQQIRDFQKKDIPFRTVLTDLLLGANPDKTATGPKDPKQALIWVVTDHPDKPGKKLILVTTRQAADGKYTLPSEF